MRGPSEQPPVVLVLSIDLDGGRSDELVLRLGDDALAVAVQFAVRNDLPPSAVDNLARLMLQSLQDTVAAKAAATEIARQRDSETARQLKESSARTLAPAAAPASCSEPNRQPGPPVAAMSPLSSSASSSTSVFSATHSQRTSGLEAEPLEADSPGSPRQRAQSTRRRAKSASSKLARSVGSPRRGRRNSLPTMFSGHPTINEHSRALAGFGVSGRPYASVFHKLHAQGVAAQRRKLETVEHVMQKRQEQIKALAKPAVTLSETGRNLVRNRGKKMLSLECPNYGSMLYVEGRERERQRAADLQLVRDKEERERLKGATWKPQISALAQRVNPIQANGEPRYTRAKQPVPPPKVVEYPFSPALDKRSVDLAKGRRPRSTAVHESLFAEAAQRRWRSEDRRLQNELFEQHHLFTVWQQLSLGGTEVLGSSDLESSLRMEELLAGTLPGQSSLSRPVARGAAEAGPAPARAAHFRPTAAPSRVLDTHMAVTSKRAEAAVPRRRVAPPFTYKYDNPATTLNRLYTVKHGPTG